MFTGKEIKFYINICAYLKIFSSEQRCWDEQTFEEKNWLGVAVAMAEAGAEQRVPNT